MPSIVRERINVKGVRARYPVSLPTIWRKVKDGAFPAPHFIGARRFWYADEVDAWIEQQMLDSAGEGQRLRAQLVSSSEVEAVAPA